MSRPWTAEAPVASYDRPAHAGRLAARVREVRVAPGATGHAGRTRAARRHRRHGSRAPMPRACRPKIGALEARLAQHPDRAAALAAMPLFSVCVRGPGQHRRPRAVDHRRVSGFKREVSAHATAVARLIEAGACAGKTNLDQVRHRPGRRAARLTGAEQHLRGRAHQRRVELGSAVVVSRGDVPFALRPDTPAPARAGGLQQHRRAQPTRGAVVVQGCCPRAAHRLRVGAGTQRADAAQVLAIIEGPDAADAYRRIPAADRRIRCGLRVGIPHPAPLVAGDIGYAAAFDKAVTQLESARPPAPCPSISHPCMRWPNCSTAGLGCRAARRRAGIDGTPTRRPRRHVRQVIARATISTATDTFRASMRLREAQARQRRAVAAGRRADGADRADTPDARRHRLRPAWARTRCSALHELRQPARPVCALAAAAGFANHGLPFGVTSFAPGAADAALARLGAQWEAQVKLPWAPSGRAFPPPQVPAPRDTPWPASAVHAARRRRPRLPACRSQPAHRTWRESCAKRRPPRRTTACFCRCRTRRRQARPAARRRRGAAIAVEVWDIADRRRGFVPCH